MRRTTRSRRILGWALVALIAVLPAYWLAANVLLATGAVERWLSSHRMTVSFERAWSIVPGRISARTATFEGHEEAREWSLRADRVRAQLNVAALLERRLEAHAVQVQNMRFDLAAPLAAGKTGLSSVSRRVRTAALLSMPPAPGRPSLVLRDIRGTVSEVSIHGVRYAGRATAEGHLLVTRTGDLHELAVRLTLENGSLHHDAEPSSRLLSGMHGTVTIERVQGNPARLEADARAESALGADERGPGRVRVRFVVKDGVVEPGGYVVYEADRFRTTRGALAARGKLTVELTSAGRREGTHRYDCLIRLDEAAVHVGSVLVNGDVRAVARVATHELVPRGLQISEVDLTLADATIRRGTAPARPWGLQAHASPVRFSARDGTVSARFSARLADASPIVEPLVDAGGLPPWIASWLVLPGLEMTGSLVHEPEVWDVRIDRAVSGPYRATGRWRATPDRRRAALLLARGPIEVGIAATRGELELQLVGGRQWLTEKLDEFPPLPARPATEAPD